MNGILNVMELFSVFVLFLFGLGVGSFLNVLVLRFGTSMKIVNGRSQCFSCAAKLGWYDLIPLVSFFAVRGHCRKCGSSISLQYPLVELLTGVVFATVWYVLFIGSTSALIVDPIRIVQFILVLAFFSLLIALSVYDIRHKIIPDEFSFVLLVIALTHEALIYSYMPSVLWEDILSGVFFGGFFATLWFVSQGRWMGLGDAKMAVSLGLFLGFPAVLVGFLSSVWIATIYGVTLILARTYSMKSEIPFGPFLALGTFIAFIVEVSFIGEVLENFFFL